MERKEYSKLLYRYHNGTDDWKYKCIDDYKLVKQPQKWKVCPNCGLIPKVWEFDNGRHTACGCGENEYNNFSIAAESIMSVMKFSDNGQDMTDYDIDGLRKNWNKWVETNDIVFDRQNSRRW